ncbi:DUF1217 domain-containing protein [Tateyamaria omphalii]|uniref:DUF1217 domain-containing protein n=1 Tax=Tateyamaria omphalii TaxID=299262 RepID=UPI001C99AD2F|nr:DUF1217 domain-containing protein [Tateyamaria omphalii]MBY5933617.1 DUF1217 domain-containing protein [Tateyamaria omphalii]
MYQPVLISSGLVGWQFLQRTYDQQLETFSQSAQVKRDTDHFAEKIGSITTAEDLVSDRQVLTVALGAFGLSEDINNKFFIEKMLGEGTTANDALANRFTDSRYREFSEAFGLGPGEVRGSLSSGFADDIISRFRANSFEIEAGNQDESMRIALYAERTLPDVVNAEGSDASKWFNIMGQPPLRSLFETALGLPDAFGQVDIDQQLSVFQERAERILGVSDPAEFATEGALDKLITTYFARAQIEQIGSGASSASIALTLLSV